MTGKTIIIPIDSSSFNANLELIKTTSGEIRINLESGLKILGKPLEWWQTFQSKPSFKKVKFSGQPIKITINNNGQLKSFYTISHHDFLALASYLAKHRNSQAINLLTYYANMGLTKNILELYKQSV